jgi:transcriptional regulator with XRE-family HTH domain
MELNKTFQKIQKLLEQRGWTLYKLSKETNIPYSSLHSLFEKNNQPTISSLEKICAGFHISMSEFFSDEPPYREETYALSAEEKEIIQAVKSMSGREKHLLYEFCKLLLQEH